MFIFTKKKKKEFQFKNNLIFTKQKNKFLYFFCNKKNNYIDNKGKK